jgi:hypothetical protein
VWPVTALKSKSGGKVSLEFIRESSNESSINSLLVGNIFCGKSSLLLFLCEETFLVTLFTLLLLSRAEVRVIKLGTIYFGNINLGGGGNNVSLVDATERDTVDLEGSSDQKKARGELSEENNTLALEATGQKNEDGARGDGSAKLSRAANDAASNGLRGILSSIVLGSLGGSGSSGLGSLRVLREFAAILLLNCPQTTANNNLGNKMVSILCASIQYMSKMTA